MPKLKVVLFLIPGLHSAFKKKSNLLENTFIAKKSLEISLNLTSQIKQLSLTHFVLIEMDRPTIIAFIHYLSTPLRRGFFSLLSYSATRLCEYIYNSACLPQLLCINDKRAEKRREEEGSMLASISQYCFVETV